jgi:hypothetical protein
MDAFHATILVMVITGQRIVLAADSRKTYLDKNGILKIGSLDKIYQTNEYYYAVCGFHEEEGSFSIHQQLHHFLCNCIDLNKDIKKLITSLANSLKQYFSSFKYKSPEVFNQFKKYSTASGEIFIVKRINNIPTAWLIDYHITGSESINVSLKTWGADITNFEAGISCFWRAIGNTGSLATAISEKEWMLQPELSARHVIEEGIAKSPNFVSKPINILTFTHQGVYWTEKSLTSPNHVSS